MSSDPQWKIFQPPVTPPTIAQDTFQSKAKKQDNQIYKNVTYASDLFKSLRSTGYNYFTEVRFTHSLTKLNGDGSQMGDSFACFNSSNLNSSQYDASNHAPIRETGIIEKLLHSYGFIQCCERQARLFFHFSQFSGTIEHLKIGDPVEFEMTYDRRTGKPIASIVTKIAPEVVLSEARVTGTVTTELKSEGSGDTTGRISYENRGECFFLPYTKDDVEGNVTLKSGDAVSFQIATNQRGNLGACHVRFENPVHPVKYHGVVCSMKESFGFIERADVVKEIFFHFTESRTKEELNLGDDVEFIIQTRNGKEVACNITRLPGGSVVFEDVCPEIIRGQVLKPLERSNNTRMPQNDPLPGRIRYRAPDHSEVEVPFGDKDQCGEFTLKHGDWVQFQAATDRRDQLKRATNISLLDESFHVSGERRECGVVFTLKDGYGFIHCVEREPKLFFNFAEVLRLNQDLCLGDEVEFTVDPIASSSNMNGRQSAIRIKHLPIGTVQFESVLERGVRGTVTKEVHHIDPGNQINHLVSQDPAGLIAYQLNGLKKTIAFSAKDCDCKMLPRTGDKVWFDIYQIKRNKELVAMNIQIQPTNGSSNNMGTSRQVAVHLGFVAALKDSFGFIEAKDHTKEIFFHFSNFEGTPDKLELGREVEYCLGRSTASSSSGGCTSADSVRLLPRGAIKVAKPLEPSINGTVRRTLRALNPDQPDYQGLIQASNGNNFEYGITSLANKRELLQVGDPVTFQADTEGRATNIVPIKKKCRAKVDFIKGGFGFLCLEVDEGKRLFFHMSEVRNCTDLQSGDLVEFVMVTNSRTGKSSACNVTRISCAEPGSSSMGHSRKSGGNGCLGGGKTARPERLISRLRSTSIEENTGPRTMVVRQPRGPDGTRGFRPRITIAPGALVE